MDLNFSDLIPFETLCDHTDWYPDLDNGGIYIAFAVSDINGSISPEKLLYIGKAESPTNNLGKRIKEHGTVPTGKMHSDHSIWRKNRNLDKFQKIAYCFAPMEDMDAVEDIEKKLIWENQPCCNIQNKDRDNSSTTCPTISITAPFESGLKGYESTLETYLCDLQKK